MARQSADVRRSAQDSGSRDASAVTALLSNTMFLIHKMA
jgi:hypothetical protein